MAKSMSNNDIVAYEGGDYGEIMDNYDLHEIAAAIANRAGKAADTVRSLEQEVERLENNPDVVDIVDTYADLQAYDTSTLTDKDIIRVIADETKGGLSSYYRWNSPNPGWNFVGVIPGGDGIKELSSADYNYPTSDPDRVALWLLDNGLYTAPAGVMVAASTTSYPWYNTSDKTILVGGSDTVKGIYTFLNGKVDVVTTQASDGTEAEEYTLLKSNQVVQTTGTSTTDVMSQVATTRLVYADPANMTRIKIGANTSVGSAGSVAIGPAAANYAAPGATGGVVSIAMGNSARTYATNNIAIGDRASAGSNSIRTNAVSVGTQSNASENGSLAIGCQAVSSATGAIALGGYSVASTVGQMDISTTVPSWGYNSSNYRLLSGVYDGQSAHDAATYGQVISYSAINGAGAPTTATEGKYVGQLYYDTTNEEMYFLKTIDTTTTPATYTWEALGGGSSVNVVQTTGDSQTDVMSQNATTKMIYPDTSTKDRVSIGSGDAAIAKNISIFGTLSSISGSTPCIALGGKISVVNGTSIAIGNNSEIMGSQSGEGYSVAIGSGCKTTGGHGISIGSSCRAGYNTNQGYNIAIGINASAYYSSNSQMQGALAIGYGANTSSNSSIAIGRSTTLDSYCSSGIGIGSNATMYNSENSVLLGRNSTATNVQNSVGLGSYSKPTVSGQVDISTNASTSNYGYNGSKYRLLSGVYDPQSDHDAATKGYVDPALGSSAPTAATVGRLGQIYVDTSTATAYMCTAIDTTVPSYTWKQITA